MTAVLLSLLALTAVPSIHALGPTFPPASFEELVRDSTHIIMGKVLSASREQEGEARFKRKVTVQVARTLKGDLSAKEIVIDQDVLFSTLDVAVTEGSLYLLFLHHEKSADSFQYQRPDWACWEIVNGQLINRRSPLIAQTTQIPMPGFLSAIMVEMHRVRKPLARSFAGIQMGDSLQQASRSSRFEFAKYEQMGDDANWERYYALLPKARPERLVTLGIYKGKILYLDIYLQKDSVGWPDFLRQTEVMSHATPLDRFGDLSFVIGRMWSDQNVTVRLGALSFSKANGYPWGEFNAYQLSVTDHHVLNEYHQDNLRQLRSK